MDYEAGTLLAGKYRVERVIGRGGMGVVLAVVHEKLEQRMALKLMDSAAYGGEAVARFLREARAAARIQSQHVVRVFDVGELESGEPYMAMEYLEGSDVAAVITAQGTLRPEQAVDYLLQACEALAEAHTLGIVHRDLKPSNLFVVTRVGGFETVKLLDFGISKVLTPAGARSDGAITRTRSLLGSPLYMSPEHMLSSRDVDARSDIWALGVVLYEMLTGTLPFLAETMPEICALVLSGAPVPIEQHRPGLPQGLVRVILRCLEKRPEDRFANVAELAQTLGPFGPLQATGSVERISRVLGAVPRSAGAPLPASTVIYEAGTRASWSETNPRSETNPPLRARRRRLLSVGIPLLLVGGGVALALTLHSLRAPRADAEQLAGSVAQTTRASVPATTPPPPQAPEVQPVLEPLASATAVASAASIPNKRRMANPASSVRVSSSKASSGGSLSLGVPGARSRQ